MKVIFPDGEYFFWASEETQGGYPIVIRTKGMQSVNDRMDKLLIELLAQGAPELALEWYRIANFSPAKHEHICSWFLSHQYDFLDYLKEAI